MTFTQEIASFVLPTRTSVSAVPKAGTLAPTSSLLPIPPPDSRPMVVTFLRHCGCPFAEKTFKLLRELANEPPNSHVRFVAVSHSDDSATNAWVEALGGPGSVEILIDAGREVYALWGLGISSFSHFMSPSGLWAVYQLGKTDGIHVRSTESGSRWQTSGSFAVDGEGIVRWGHPMASAGEIPDFREALRAVN
ncbi:unnamed protein product [Mycena citricolor]|uniref:Thioredoxin domain-containing protein n=1 Tax=Mycena citricolor TaxID=2018698 RepID=A0AAD2HXQ8_9AGAR|nr:unnamed protein product [Mycena citricolor]